MTVIYRCFLQLFNYKSWTRSLKKSQTRLLLCLIISFSRVWCGTQLHRQTMMRGRRRRTHERWEKQEEQRSKSQHLWSQNSDWKDNSGEQKERKAWSNTCWPFVQNKSREPCAKRNYKTVWSLGGTNGGTHGWEDGLDEVLVVCTLSYWNQDCFHTNWSNRSDSRLSVCV